MFKNKFNLKKFLFLCILIIVCLAVMGYVLLNSTFVGEKVITAMIEKNFKDISVTSIDVTKQTFTPLNRLTLNNIQLEIQSKQESLSVSLESIQAVVDRRDAQKGFGFTINIRGLQADSRILKVNNAAATLRMLSGAIKDGDVRADTLTYLEYDFENIQGIIQGVGDTLKIVPLKADFYAGILETEISLENTDQFIYSIKTRIKGVELSRLARANKAVFSNAKGTMDGDITLAGRDPGGYTIEGRIFASSQAHVKAAMLKPLLDYIPQSRQKKDLDALLKEGGDIPLDSAQIILLSVTDETTRTRVELKSTQFNLDIGVNLDFNIEHGLANILHLQKQYFLKKRQ